jgi:hypothetical protein
VKLIDPNGMEIFDTEGGPDDPMGKGNGPAPNQTKNKPAPLTFPTSNNLPNKQNKTSQSSSTPAKTPKFKFNFNLDGGGGVHFYNNSDRDRPGPDRKTNRDVNMVDISNFPTGTGSSGSGSVPELVLNLVGLFERGGTITEAVMDYNQAVQNQKNKEKVDAHNNATIFFEIYIDNNGSGYTVGTSCPRKDSLDEVKKVRETHERK